MEIAARLAAEAERANQRRLLVVTGESAACRAWASDALAATDIGPGETVFVGPDEFGSCRNYTRGESEALLGTSWRAVVLDCHERCEPNLIGRLVGTVTGGGLFVLLTPPLAAWPERRDAFDRSLAVPPFELTAVGRNFRERFVETLRVHHGVTVVDAASDTVQSDGSIEPAPRLATPDPTPPTDGRFPRECYRRCRTQDQADAVAALEALATPGEAVVLESNRGRGKSSAAGLAAGALATEGRDVLVTAPDRRNAGAVFERARELLTELGGAAEADEATNSVDSGSVIRTGTGGIRYERPTEAATLPDSPDVVIVDEAAALPVRLLEGTLDAPAVAYTTTIHGYEGAGRGFSNRFRDRLTESDLSVTERTLTEPIRYAAADPIEVWSFRVLALDASPPPAQLVDDATPDTVEYRQFTGRELRDDENLLASVFGLLVDAHYRTEPNDLARLLDGPNISVHCLFADGHVAAVALCAQEGGFDAELCRRVADGERIRGNLLPDVLASQLGDERAGESTGWRVMRIGVHEAVRSRGLGSLLLDHVRERARDRELDWFGVSYGVTPELASFWNKNGFGTIHLSTTRNARSGEHSILMLDPLTPTGRELFERHTAWFLRRAPAAIRESLSAANPAVVRSACRAARGTPDLDLTDREWQHAARMGDRKAIFETAPRGTQQLCFRHLVDPAAEVLDGEEWAVLVRKGVQGQSWEEVTEAVGFHSESTCKRTLGTVVGKLVDLYRPETESTRSEP